MEDIKAGLYVLWRCMTILFLLLLTKARTHSSFNCKWLDPAIDIREKVGVKINKISGSRAEYIPFPFGYRMNPGDSVSLEFRTSSSHGLIFLAGNFDRADLASAYLRRGFVIFARRCAYGKAFESHSELLVDDGKWHKMIYNHTAEGGTLYVDGVEDVSYRTHYMGPCGSFNSLVFGGLSRKVYGTTGFRGIAEDEHEPDKIVKHRFSGCIRNLHFGNKWPVVPPNTTPCRSAVVSQWKLSRRSSNQGIDFTNIDKQAKISRLSFRAQAVFIIEFCVFNLLKFVVSGPSLKPF